MIKLRSLSLLLSLTAVFASVQAATADEMQTQTIQRYLNILGYESGTPDGIFGRKTKSALEQFYDERNLRPTTSSLEALLTHGFSTTAASKSPSFRMMEMLPKVPEKSDLRLCRYVANSNFIDVEWALKNNDFRVIDVNSGDNDDKVEQINERANQFLSQLWAEPSEKNARITIELFKFLFNQNYASIPKNNSEDNSLQIKEFIKTTAYALSVLDRNDLINSNEKLLFLGEIQKRFDAIKNAKKYTYDMHKCAIGRDIFYCQNHTYNHQHVRTLYGAAFNSPVDFEMGEKMFKFAIDDLADDGALWREASRGKWSWSYYGNALGILLAIAEIYEINGYDLYSYRSKISGQTIHDAVAFLLRSIEKPAEMWKYSSAQAGVNDREGYQDYKSNEYYGLLINRSEMAGLKNWYYVYRSRFPDHENTKKGERLITTNLAQMRSSNNLGFLAQCIYTRPTP